MAATMAGKAEAVQLLLDHGADPNVQPHGMRSALYVAAQSGDADIVRMLLDGGAWPMAGPEWQPELPAVSAARAYWDALQQWSTDEPSGAFAKAKNYKRCFRVLLDAVALHISRFREVCARSRLSGLRERAGEGGRKGFRPDTCVWKVHFQPNVPQVTGDPRRVSVSVLLTKLRHADHSLEAQVTAFPMCSLTRCLAQPHFHPASAHLRSPVFASFARSPAAKR